MKLIIGATLFLLSLNAFGLERKTITVQEGGFNWVNQNSSNNLPLPLFAMNLKSEQYISELKSLPETQVYQCDSISTIFNSQETYLLKVYDISNCTAVRKDEIGYK